MTDEQLAIRFVLVNVVLVFIQLALLGSYIYEGAEWSKIYISVMVTSFNVYFLVTSINTYKRFVAEQQSKLIKILSTPSEKL